MSPAKQNGPRRHVVHFIAAMDVGGAERTLLGLLRALSGDPRIAHSVVTIRRPGPMAEQVRQLGIELRTLTRLRDVLAVLRLLVALRPICQGWMLHGNLLAGACSAVARRRSIWTVHSTEASRPFTSLSTEWLSRVSWVFQRLTRPAVVSCSFSARDFHVDGLHYAPSRFEVIPAHFDLMQFRFDAVARAERREQLGFTNELVFGAVGRWSEQKDYANVVRSFAVVRRELPEARLVLIGRQLDAANEQLGRWLADEAIAGDDVRLLGERSDVVGWYSALDVLVLGSCGGESFPMVVGEAMACERIAVVTDVGDAEEIVGPAGRVVPPRRSDLLAQAMLAAAAEVSALDGRRWAASRGHIDSAFSEAVITERWLRLYGLG